MKLYHIVLLLVLLMGATTVSAQSDKIAAQKRVIASLEQKIAKEEREIAKIKRGKAASQELTRRLVRQISSRSRLMDETEKEADLLKEEIKRKDVLANDLGARLDTSKNQYAAMVREAYRNYRQQNYISYIFSSKDFNDMARKITAMREVAAMRRNKLAEIEELTTQVKTEREQLDRRKLSLDSVSRQLADQKLKLERDASSARRDMQRLSEKERSALRRKMAQEQQLSVAISELRKLTKGNKEGASFSYKTSGLHLPVAGGSVKRYKGNMAEVVGHRGAAVISIYEGKIVEIKKNRITEKYDVFVAHGEYITSYANLGSVSVTKGQKVSRNQQIGTVGAAVDFATMKTEYRIIFGIYPPNPRQQMSAAQCFRK